MINWFSRKYKHNDYRIITKVVYFGYYDPKTRCTIHGLSIFDDFFEKVWIAQQLFKPNKNSKKYWITRQVVDDPFKFDQNIIKNIQEQK